MINKLKKSRYLIRKFYKRLKGNDYLKALGEDHMANDIVEALMNLATSRIPLKLKTRMIRILYLEALRDTYSRNNAVSALENIAELNISGRLKRRIAVMLKRIERQQKKEEKESEDL